MQDSLRLFGAFGFSLVAVLVATPVAIRVAGRTGFLDKPVGYKGHKAPTPYLGGAAVMVGFLAGALAFGGGQSALAPIAAGAVALWAVGTIDDRITVTPRTRVLAEVVAAALLSATGHGWEVFGNELLNLGVTALWIVGLVNAFNLMDNMDGAASSVAAVSASGAAGLALADGQVGLACAALALMGACVGFMPYNLRSPARIFLGDGGSMPVGFIVAATVMAVGQAGGLGLPALLAAVVLVALPILDTTLVVISRRRRGVSVLTGGRDHVTHRLRVRLPSARAVALTLGAIQAVLCAAVVAAAQVGAPLLVALFGLLLVLGASSIGMLETGIWAPQAPVRPRPLTPNRPATAVVEPAEASRVELVLLGVLAAGAGASAFVDGLYPIGSWGPVAVGLLAVLVALSVQRTAALSGPARAALGSVAFLWAWALTSALWAESVDSAMHEAARWLLYVTLFAVALLALRGRRARLVVAAAAVGGLGSVSVYVGASMLAGNAGDLFLGGRLNGPLGYVNGQASYLLLLFWPLLAVAERARWALARGSALAGATAVLGLVLLTQTRAIIPALGLSAAAIVLVVPGRERRLWALCVAGAALLVAAQPVLDVYSSARVAGGPDQEVLNDAMRALLAASAIAGAAWTLASRGLVAIDAPGGARSLRLAVRATLAAVVLVAALVAVSSLGNPAERLRQEVSAFVELRGTGADDTRFLSGGGYRYDYWRVAVEQFRDDPLRGVGAGNFERTYFLERRTAEDVRQAHSLELQVLGELGLPGGLALAGFLTVVLISFGRLAALARRDPARIATLVGAGGVFITWLAHTSVDWLHLLPGLTALALFAAALLVNDAAPPRGAGTGRRLMPMLAITVAIAGVLTTGRLALADHYREKASRQVASAPGSALADARTALRLNSQSTSAHFTQAAAFARRNDYARARASLLVATRLEPHNFLPWALLGDLAVRRGDTTAAARHYARASALNPRDPALRRLARDPDVP